MSFRKTISWCLFPITMWYAIGVWLRNLMFDLGIKHQEAPPVTTIGVGNICAGGTGKTPHVEYLLRLLSDNYRTAMLSRGYRRKSHGYLLDDGSHNAQKLGDEPAMIASKFPKVQVAVCEKRLVGIQKLLAQDQPPQLVVLDDAFQHRYVKPTVNILLTEYGNPFYNDHIMPYGNLREGRRARFRANIIIVTKSPEKLNPVDRHNMVQMIDAEPYQKIFFSYIHYCDPIPLMGGTPLPLDTLDGALALTGIANPDPMIQHMQQLCPTIPLKYADHHSYTVSDIKHIRKVFETQVQGSRKAIITTEKDAARLRQLAGGEALVGLPIYYLPIEVRIHNNKEYDFDQTILNSAKENTLFRDKMKNSPLINKTWL